jgi:hypothetical protein
MQRDGTINILLVPKFRIHPYILYHRPCRHQQQAYPPPGHQTRTPHSVNKLATPDASTSAVLTTLRGSTIPALIMSTYSPFLASYPHTNLSGASYRLVLDNESTYDDGRFFACVVHDRACWVGQCSTNDGDLGQSLLWVRVWRLCW